MASNRRSLIYNSKAEKKVEDICTVLLGGTVVEPNDCTKSFALALAIAKNGTASAHQLKYLGLFNDSIDPLHLISQKATGIIKAKSVKYSDNLATAYNCSSQLKRYLDERFLNIDNDDKPQYAVPITGGDSLSHSLASNDINFFLVGYPGFPIIEDYKREYGIILKKDIGDKHKGDIPLRADASYLYRITSPIFSNSPGRSYPIRHYVEADSGKQRISVILDKIDKYMTYAGFNSVVSCALSSIDFSIFLPDKDYMSVSDKRQNKLTSSFSYLHLTYLMQQNKLKNFNEAHDLLEKSKGTLTAYNDSELLPIGILKKHYSSLANFVDKLLSEGVTTFDEVEKYCQEVTGDIAENVKERLDKHYVTRRKDIFDTLVSGLPSLTAALLQGLEFCAIPNHDLYSVYPFCYPRACQLDDAIMKFLSFWHADSLLEYYHYKTLDNNVTLKNGYNTGKKTFYVENVDASLGGMIRVRQYFKYKENLSNDSVQLICLVKDKAAALDFADFCESEGVIISYADYCRYKGIKAPIAADKALRSGISIPVFVTYDDVWKLHNGSHVHKDMFIVQSKGKTSSI